MCSKPPSLLGATKLSLRAGRSIPSASSSAGHKLTPGRTTKVIKVVASGSLVSSPISPWPAERHVEGTPLVVSWGPAKVISPVGATTAKVSLRWASEVALRAAWTSKVSTRSPGSSSSISAGAAILHVGFLLIQHVVQLLCLHEQGVFLMPLAERVLLLLHPTHESLLVVVPSLLLLLHHLAHLSIPGLPVGLLLVSVGLAHAQLVAQLLRFVFIAGVLHLGDQLVFLQLHLAVQSFLLLFLHLVQALPLLAIFELERLWIGKPRTQLRIKMAGVVLF